MIEIIYLGFPVIFTILIFSWWINNCISSTQMEYYLTNKNVLITGGSSGIGLSMARYAWKYGANTIICGRNKDKLENAIAEIKNSPCKPSSRLTFLQVDITTDYSSLEKIMMPYLKKIDILVNCAGGAVSREFCETSPSDIQAQMNQNYIGAAHLTRIFLPSMLQDSGAQKNVLFVSSMAGQLGLYGMSAYSASKFALRGLAESLKMELVNSNVKITVVFPPDTDTPGLKTENEGKPEATKVMSESAGLLNPDEVALQIWRSCVKRDFYCYFGSDGWMVTLLTYGFVLPQSMFDCVSLVLLAPIIRLIAYGYGGWMYWVCKKHGK